VKIHHEIEPPSRPCALAIGFFDGFHRGHREIVRAMRRRRAAGTNAAVLTFVDHPAAYLRPGTEPPLLTTLDERINLLAAAGVDDLYLLPFDARIASIEARTFVERVLLGELRARALVFGENFRFGAKRGGDAALAREVCGARCEVVAVRHVEDGGERISSTRIRALVLAGRMTEANALLGESYVLRGRVELGRGKGHDFGFPTANLVAPAEKTLPADGVYAIVGRYDGRDHAGLVSIGTNPTFDGTARTVEAWLLDFHATIYGEELQLRDFRFVRAQQRFASVDELVAQMLRDATHARFPSFLT